VTDPIDGPHHRPDGIFRQAQRARSNAWALLQPNEGLEQKRVHPKHSVDGEKRRMAAYHTRQVKRGRIFGS
jgi:hypothetical protein